MTAFDLTADCAECGATSAACDNADKGCCESCRATGGCSHQRNSRTAACTCSAGADARFPAQHATRCPRYKRDGGGSV